MEGKRVQFENKEVRMTNDHGPTRVPRSPGATYSPGCRARRHATPWRVLLYAALICVSSTPAVQAEPTEAERLFTLRVLPLLKVKCFGCHGNDAEDIRGDYDARSRAGLLKGGESEEPSLVPGKPDESPLYAAVMWDGLEMPPKENDRLTEQETAYIRQWIAAGAPWPDEKQQRKIQEHEWSVIENADGRIVTTSGGLADDWTYRRYRPEDLWAFQPVKQIDVANLAAPGQHPIDAFVTRRLDAAKLEPAQQADALTLIRRATYDLTGLPPTPQEVQQFRQAWDADPQQAWQDLITRLLASNHYGERWAQHWLDVVRYADTSGFSNDYERSNAWRYRDYVIRSFNRDQPFNAFIVEQLAGDEIAELQPAASDKNQPQGGELNQADQENDKVASDKVAATAQIPAAALELSAAELRVATGMLRMGPWGTAMIPQDEARQLFLDDLVNNVGQAFLSMPLRCCKCHDHKFDPLPTRDYYSVYATFAATQPAEIAAPFLPEENRNGFAEKRALVEELLEYATAERDQVLDKQEAAAKKWYAEHDLPYKNVNARKNDPEAMKPPRHVGLTPEEQGVLKVREQDVWIWERRLERYQPMAQGVYNGQDDWKNSRKLRPPKKINQTWRPANFILGGGSLTAKLEPVTPGVLSATGLAVRDRTTRGSYRPNSQAAAWRWPSGLPTIEIL